MVGAGVDDAVRAAMAKWPDVPAVYGWLTLDARGRWRVRHEFLEHRGLTDFIGRNYLCDDDGQWFFQNGPQRVFVALEYTPWVLRLDANGSLTRHTGKSFDQPTDFWLDDEGRLLASADGEIGVVHDGDLNLAIARLAFADNRPASLESLLADHAPDGTIGIQLADGWHPVRHIARAEVANRFGFVTRPTPPEGSDQPRP